MLFVLAGCGQAPTAPPEPVSPEVILTVSTPEASLGTMAISRRWQPSDIYQYEVSLRRWNGTTFTDLAPQVTVILPQKDAPKQQARFTHLKQGERYQVAVVAKGNPGGTAPQLVMNAETPCVADLDMKGAQDVEQVWVRTLSVTLDAAPFAGTLTLIPENTPSGTAYFRVDLVDATSGATRYSGTFQKGQIMTLSNLRTAIRYQVRLSAHRGGGRLIETLQSAILHFDPAAPEHEQDHVLPMAFTP